MRALFEFICWIILLGMLCCIATVRAAAKKEYPLLKVAVIDTGLDLKDERLSANLCLTGSKDFSGKGLEDHYGHGTHVVGLIEKYADTSPYCIVMLKYSDNGLGTTSIYLEALEEAINQHPDIVNISINSGGFSEEEYSSVCDHPEILFVVASGNDHTNLDAVKSYPASIDCPNVITVGSTDYTGANYGKRVTRWEPGLNILSTLPNGKMGTMTGTSMSCAIATGKLIYEKTHLPN